MTKQTGCRLAKEWDKAAGSLLMMNFIWWEAGLEEDENDFKSEGRNISNMSYADDTSHKCNGSASYSIKSQGAV